MLGVRQSALSFATLASLISSSMTYPPRSLRSGISHELPVSKPLGVLTDAPELTSQNLEMKVAAIIALLLHYVAAQEAFSITSRYPPKADPSAVAVVHRVRKGESLTLSCSASEKFNMCRWARPSSSSKQQAPCGIFSGDERKRCGKSGSMSDWTVVREGETTCKVVIDEVDVEEAGEWSCELQSFPNENKAYKTAQEYTMVELVQPATVELRGALEIVLYEGEDAEFYCQATGVPGPQSLEFAIGRAPIEDLRLEEENFDDKRREVRATAKVKKAWGGKKLTCVARQVDDEGNEVESTDVRNLRVEAERPRHRGNEQAASAKAGEFAIFDRYPQGANGAYPTMTIAKEVPVTFSCTSTEPWHVCRWMRPDSGDPCGIFSDDTHVIKLYTYIFMLRVMHIYFFSFADEELQRRVGFR